MEPLLETEDQIIKVPIESVSFHIYEERDQTHPKFVNFDEEEEVTVIHELTCLQTAPWKKYLLVPILSLMSAFIFAICLYWSVPL